MEVILREDIEKLGSRGDVVTVAPGYARNYLLPRRLALEAVPGNLKRLEKIRGALNKRTATERDQAQKQAADVRRLLPEPAGDLEVMCRVSPRAIDLSTERGLLIEEDQSVGGQEIQQ